MEYVEELPISCLTFLERNPRNITTDQMAKLQKSLKEDPDYITCRPILVALIDGDHVVYAGNQRVRAAKKLGWKKIKCHIDDDLSEYKMQSRIIKDNKTYGFFDWEELGNTWDPNLLLDCGFKMEELHLDSFDPLDPKEPKEKPSKCKLCPNCGHDFKK